MGWLTTIAIVGIVAVSFYVSNRDERNRWMIVELAKSAAVERPHLDSMCANYFAWAKQANDHVPGMEKHCAKPFIEVQSR